MEYSYYFAKDKIKYRCWQYCLAETYKMIAEWYSLEIFVVFNSL